MKIKLSEKAKTSKLNKTPSYIKSGEKLITENEICERDDCEAIAYDWNHSNGDTYPLCPFHWYEGFAHDIDQAIRDCWPINWKLSKPQQEVINYIRGEVNSLLSETEREYELFSNIKKTNEKLQRLKRKKYESKTRNK